MNAFFGATWSGMSMINDLDHKVVERFLATPASRFSLVLSQIVRSALDRGDPGDHHPARRHGARRAHPHRVLGWLVIVLAAILVNSAFAGISQAIALLTRREATMIAVANFIGLPLLFLSSTMIAARRCPSGCNRQQASTRSTGAAGRRAKSVLPGANWSIVGSRLLLLARPLGSSLLAWATGRSARYQRAL